MKSKLHTRLSDVYYLAGDSLRVEITLDLSGLGEEFKDLVWTQNPNLDYIIKVEIDNIWRTPTCLVSEGESVSVAFLVPKDSTYRIHCEERVNIIEWKEEKLCKEEKKKEMYKYNGNDNVRVDNLDELLTMDKFRLSYTGDIRERFCVALEYPEQYKFPIVVHCLYNHWEWDLGNLLNGDELSVGGFLEKQRYVRYVNEGSDFPELNVIPSDVGNTKVKTEWTDEHYDVNYKLTPKDIENGYVRMDVYQVNKLWKINSSDPTGAGFHTLKCLGRLARNKNTKEREIKAMHGQIKRWAEIEGITL